MRADQGRTASLTAGELLALARFRESNHSEPLFDDPWAGVLTEDSSHRCTLILLYFHVSEVFAVTILHCNRDSFHPALVHEWIEILSNNYHRTRTFSTENVSRTRETATLVTTVVMSK